MTCHQHHPVNKTISTPEEIEDLAFELADDYIEYFDIDTTKEQKKYSESIEECLAHLEEVIFAMDGYKQKSDTIDKFVATVVSKKAPMGKLYEQVDSLEQYAFETNRLLDGLEQSLKDLESHIPSSSSKIKQILGLLPRSLPMFGLFGSYNDVIDSRNSLNQSNSESSDQLVPINNILERLSQIETEMDCVTVNLGKRLGWKEVELASSNVCSESLINKLKLDTTTENVDHSWQELL